jgi:hypothetical protein
MIKENFYISNFDYQTSTFIKFSHFQNEKTWWTSNWKILFEDFIFEFLSKRFLTFYLRFQR